MKISIVVTAHNNERTIINCLNSLTNQSLKTDQYEIIVVSDGSTDSTNKLVEKYIRTRPYIRLIKTHHQGVALARNNGAHEALYEVILYTQADIVAKHNLVNRHLKYHTEHPQKTYAMVGYTTWNPNMKITAFMKWLQSGGPQFDFKRLKGSSYADFLAFYTSNLSIKKEFLLENGGFDVNFKGPKGITAYEDTELGFRLQKKGMQLFYDPQAVAYHDHPKDLKSVVRRRYYEGIMSHRLTKKHPDLKWPRKLSDRDLFLTSVWILNPIVMMPAYWLGKLIERKIKFPQLFKLITRAYYNWGYLRGFM